MSSQDSKDLLEIYVHVADKKTTDRILLISFFNQAILNLHSCTSKSPLKNLDIFPL